MKRSDRKKDAPLTNRPPRNQTEANAVKDMYANPAANTGFASSSLVNGGVYVPYRISLDYMQLLNMYRGSWKVRNIIDCVPEDMLKAFPTLQTEMDANDIIEFGKMVADTMTLQKLVEGLKWGRLFGGALGIIILAGAGQKDLSKPLKLDDVEPGSYRGLIIVDRWSGISPSSQLISNIDHPAEYGLPEHYDVTTEVSQTFKVHHTRCLRFTGRDLPLFEKQIQTYWGMSELEAILQELQRSDYIDSGTADLVARASILVMNEPTLAQMLSGLSLTQQQYNDYIMRMKAVSESISTNGILAIGSTEDGSAVTQMNYSFAGLRDIHDASTENLSGASGIPVERWGKPISGLGNTGEGSLQVYYDNTDQKRNREVRPILNKLIPIMCMSQWGEVPEDLDYAFAPMRTMSSKEQAELAKAKTEPVFTALEKGVLSDKSTLMELKSMSSEIGVFTTITEEMIEAASDELVKMDQPPGLGDETEENEDELNENAPGNGGVKDAVMKWWKKVSG